MGDNASITDWLHNREREMRVEYVEKLSLHEQFKLVEIAHESRDYEVKRVALAVLGKYLNPLVMVVPDAPLSNGQCQENGNG